jgi:hypothetical protein
VNKERPNEKAAKQIVESVLGIEFVHADSTGGVDYRSTDGEHAVEVTRITDGRKKAARDALRTSRASATPDVTLQNCWLVLVPDTQHGMKTALQYLPPLFAQLEATGETYFDRHAAAVDVIERGPLAHIYQPLLIAGIERATGHSHASGPPHKHRVIPSWEAEDQPAEAMRPSRSSRRLSPRIPTTPPSSPRPTLPSDTSSCGSTTTLDSTSRVRSVEMRLPGQTKASGFRPGHRNCLPPSRTPGLCMRDHASAGYGMVKAGMTCATSLNAHPGERHPSIRPAWSGSNRETCNPSKT